MTTELITLNNEPAVFYKIQYEKENHNRKVKTFLYHKKRSPYRQVLNRTDVAGLVADSTEELKPCDKELLELFRKKEIPYLIAWNKCDLLDENAEEKLLRTDSDGSIPTAGICVSALQKTGIQELKECIAHLGQEDSGKKALVRDLIRPLDRIILVIPIDKAAPKGRLILPQQQVIRDILEEERQSVYGTMNWHRTCRHFRSRRLW